ncbi:ran-binding protein M homolog isoform X2 [Daucus carota subsp. sativus]|uniref:ran-binding protein M homolog isoform X2 n=1 Tax=Daucus carota subsp. sativus TaxID=79200 RepID=UPI0007EF78B1|nr:PREDICTED: uncharacterized protein LOC108197068 isoform X2 [Daucus carota subsp. sativus]
MSASIKFQWKRWEANSYGYHGDDGYLYRGQGKGEKFGPTPTYTANDTVGGGINYASQKFFFTKNGEMVGEVCKEVKGRLYPNSYHCCTQPERRDDTSATCFLLHCQKFIELVREANLEKAIFYGRSAFEKFYEFEEDKDLLKDCSALLVYAQLEKSSVGYLLEDSQREIVVDAVNAFVLSVNPNLEDRKSCSQSHLEKLLRQLTACFLEGRSLNGTKVKHSISTEY